MLCIKCLQLNLIFAMSLKICFEYLWKRILIRKSLKWKCRMLFVEINWSGDICWHFTQLSIKHQPFYSTCLFLILEYKTIVEETKAIAHNAHNNHQHHYSQLENNTKYIMKITQMYLWKTFEKCWMFLEWKLCRFWNEDQLNVI